MCTLPVDVRVMGAAGIGALLSKTFVPIGPKLTPFFCFQLVGKLWLEAVSLNWDKMRLPEDKFDLDAVLKLEAAGFPAIAPFLDDLVAWVADGNWPVARPVADLLVSIGADAIPVLRQVLQGSDAIHQQFVLLLVASRLSPDVAAALRGDLERLVTSPTLDQIREGVSELAEGILQKLGN